MKQFHLFPKIMLFISENNAIYFRKKKKFFFKIDILICPIIFNFQVLMYFVTGGVVKKGSLIFAQKLGIKSGPGSNLFRDVWGTNTRLWTFFRSPSRNLCRSQGLPPQNLVVDPLWDCIFSIWLPQAKNVLEIRIFDHFWAFPFSQMPENFEGVVCTTLLVSPTFKEVIVISIQLRVTLHLYFQGGDWMSK